MSHKQGLFDVTEITRPWNAGFLCQSAFPSPQNLLHFCPVERGSEMNTRAEMLDGHWWPP